MAEERSLAEKLMDLQTEHGAGALYQAMQCQMRLIELHPQERKEIIHLLPEATMRRLLDRQEAERAAETYLRRRYRMYPDGSRREEL